MKNQIITLLLNIFVRFFHLTYRYVVIGEENIIKAKGSNKFETYVLCTWHQMMFSTLTHCIGKQYALIVSRSKDGDFIANVCKTFGHIPARGSSSKGGKEALIEVIKVMKKGVPAAMAVDGPRGPFHEPKPGSIEMARQTNSCVVPWSSYPDRFWCFHKSWDKFILPKPFAKIVIVYGEPILVNENVTREEFESLNLLLKNKLIEGEELAKSKLV